MNNWKFLYISLIIIFFSLGTILVLDIVKSSKIDNQKNKILKDYRLKLKSCFDLENKNERKINESLKLIEYCVKEFGIY